jgi:hypothetical protein
MRDSTSFRHYLRVPGQTEWDAMPLALRVRLCAQCHWIDAVYEVFPPLGRVLSRMKTGRSR